MRCLIIEPTEGFEQIRQQLLSEPVPDTMKQLFRLDGPGLPSSEAGPCDVVIYCYRQAGQPSEAQPPRLIASPGMGEIEHVEQFLQTASAVIVLREDKLPLPDFLTKLSHQVSQTLPRSPSNNLGSAFALENDPAQDAAELQDIIRKLEETQKQLLQSEKLASIGQLAAGVAHEINNPIGYVYSNLTALANYLDDLFRLFSAYETLEAELPKPSQDNIRVLKEEIGLDFLRQDVPALFNESKEGLERVKKIVMDLRDFSRTGADEEWQWADIHNCLSSTLNIVMNDLKYKATIEMDLRDVPEIYCLPSQLNQVFMNILVNAGHAIENQGTIKIAAREQDDGVLVEIRDDGNGIPAEILTKIFDPFFTTKPVGHGTGLGLALSYGIIQKHSGRINVQSAVGQGTTFSIWLPRDQPHRQQATQMVSDEGR